MSNVFKGNIFEIIKKGEANGVAPLDENKKIPNEYLTQQKVNNKSNLLNIIEWNDENTVTIDIIKGILSNNIPYSFMNPVNSDKRYENVSFNNFKNSNMFHGGIFSEYRGDNYSMSLAGGGNNTLSNSNDSTYIEIEMPDISKIRSYNKESDFPTIIELTFLVTPLKLSWEMDIKDSIVCMKYNGTEYTNLAKTDTYASINASGAYEMSYGGNLSTWGLPSLKLTNLKDLSLKIKAKGISFVNGIYMNPKIRVNWE